MKVHYGEEVWPFRASKEGAWTKDGWGGEGLGGQRKGDLRLGGKVPSGYKEVAVREYHDSDALLAELGDSFLQGFDDTLRQVKKAYPELDVSMINVDDQGQTSALPIALENTNHLFAEDAALGDGESAQAQNAQDASPKE